MKNDHDPELLHDMLVKIVHPLLATPPGQSDHVSIVPAYLDSPPNKVQMKQAFLEIIKPDE
ncbi:MAG TPA: hypothetical protein VKM55_27425 [Candidatus Lokiarchaeia archaeon]|nr:hypothetical protein [Candidatus Lokiarchaeia archaeon]